MKYIRNESVRLPAHLTKVASDAHIAVVDTAGVLTTTAQFLCGENPWGLHQDYRFSSPLSEVRRGARIVSAAEEVIAKDLDVIVLSDEDHAALLAVLASPRPSGGPMPPDFARAVLPLYEAIEFASNVKEESK
jgi:hypothetical protein